jgi:hypothetical protein
MEIVDMVAEKEEANAFNVLSCCMWNLSIWLCAETSIITHTIRLKWFSLRIGEGILGKRK